MTGGAWGLGDIAPGVEALVKLEPPVHVVAVCGKNARLEAELRSLAAAHSGRLTVYGYVSTMPELMAAANVVVTNGAGVTVLEALRTPRPVVAFAPLVGHGTASTTEMVRRNLAVEARDVPEPGRANPASHARTPICCAPWSRPENPGSRAGTCAAAWARSRRCTPPGMPPRWVRPARPRRRLGAEPLPATLLVIRGAGRPLALRAARRGGDDRVPGRTGRRQPDLDHAVGRGRAGAAGLVAGRRR